MASKHRKLTQAELLAELEARFGPDPMDWAFQCPNCGDAATGRDFREALAAHPRQERGEAVAASDVLGQECIGRTLGALSKGNGKYEGRGCNWCAYGLFSGPWTVTLPEGGTMGCFPLAPAPVAREVPDAR